MQVKYNKKYIRHFIKIQFYGILFAFFVLYLQMQITGHIVLLKMKT